MHFNTFDHYQHEESLIHRLDPRVKVVATVLFILSSALLPDGSWTGYLIAWGVVLLVTVLANVRLRFLLTRSLIAIPFALAAFSMIFTIPGTTLFAWHLGKWTLIGTGPGLLRFLSILIRSWISVQMAIMLTATTQFPDLIHALRHLRVPTILVSVVAFMYRYLYVLGDEALRMIRAREARSARKAGRGGGSVSWRARVTGNMAGQLFLRSYERSDRIYQAMVARGYQGTFLTLNPHQMSRLDWVAAGCVVLLIVFIQWAGRI